MKNKEVSIKSIKLIVLILFIIYVAILVYLLFLSPRFGRSVEHYRHYNLKPFKTISNFIRYGDLNMQVTNILGNILAFVPMGIFVPIIIRNNKKFIRILSFSMYCSLMIETIQFELSVGAFDVDDVILNTLGGMLGYIIYYLINSIFAHREDEEVNEG